MKHIVLASTVPSGIMQLQVIFARVGQRFECAMWGVVVVQVGKSFGLPNGAG